MDKEMLPEEDKELAFQSIILNLLITALDRDIESINNSKLKLKKQHVHFMEKIRQRIQKDLTQVRKDMGRKGIKVFAMENQNEDFVSYRYLIRGYESRFNCFKPALKMHTEKLLSTYYEIDYEDIRKSEK
ncbi:hypothetical protein ACFFHF_16530 [Robertmurraya beringensis]|uniref:Uncharacterized protein n=1 Tax=Robertmurraya beringensis TaxID=641660 RepID=A0ABV6KUV6_9BACI